MNMNEIKCLSKQEYENLIFDKKIKIIAIDGAEIENKNDYFIKISELFSFPQFETEHDLNYSAYIDWMTDLSWFDNCSIILVINNFSQFMKSCQQDKDTVMNIFAEDILPFWDEEVERVVIGGKRRDFNVYCIN